MRLSLLLGGIATMAAAAPALAGPVTIQSTVFSEQRSAAADGTTNVKLVPVARVAPGDNLVFRLSYRNSGAKPASGLVIANPVPANMQYAGPAENSAAPEVSVDGQNFGQLSTLRVRTNGVSRAATMADVRVVRWRLSQPVAAGGEGKVAFRALLK